MCLLPVRTEAATTSFTLDCNVGPAATLDQPGKYRLATPEANCAQGTLINIVTSNVTLDLGGRRLDGDSNTVNGNLAHGITTLDATDIIDNTANGNQRKGINADSPVFGTGNTVADNGEEPQCSPVDLCT